MTRFTKKQKRELREFAGICYDRAMYAALEDLYETFHAWKRGEISHWDVDDAIHRHHDGTARELYKRFGFKELQFPVARSILDGQARLEEVPEGCRPAVESVLAMHRDSIEDDENES